MSLQAGRLSTELAGGLVAGGTVRTLRQLSLGSFTSGMSSELYSLCNAGRSEILLLREAFQRWRQAVPPLMLAPLEGPDMMQGSNRVVVGQSSGWGGPAVWPGNQSDSDDLSQDLYKVSLGSSLASVLKGDPGPLPRPTNHHFLLLECVSS